MESHIGHLQPVPGLERLELLHERWQRFAGHFASDQVAMERFPLGGVVQNWHEELKRRVTPK